MVNPFISCIVPVYKVESFLAKCIDSLLNQTYQDFELILIDDGSPDRCGQICEEYALKDNRIKVFHLENGGVSKARNYGLLKASGEWITFVDGDDYVMPFFLENLITPLRNNKNIDFVHGGYLYEKEEKQNIGQCYADRYFAENDMDEVFLLYRGLVFSKLFRRSIVAEYGIIFDENMKISEDLCFTMDYLMHIRSAYFCSGCDYVYIFRTDSATQKQSFDAEFLYHGFKHQLCSMRKAIALFAFSDRVVKYRMGQIAKDLVNYVCYLYKNPQSRAYAKKQLIRIPSDEISVLKYYPFGGRRYWVSKLLRKRWFFISDFLLTVIYKLKN